MRGTNAKMLRRVFKDRKTYKRAKHTYTRSTIREKLKAKEDIQEILESGKEVKHV